MAHPEHLATLQRGPTAWNRWRQDHPDIVPDLRWANLSLLTLRGADLRGALLDRATLSGATLSQADLSAASLREASLSEANLSSAVLDDATLSRANLSRATLSRATLQGADLSGANLGRTNLYETSLHRATLDDAFFYKTAFGNTRLAGALGLDTCRHLGPSLLDHRTLAHHPHLPAAFLRGCGLHAWEIEAAKLHDPTLTPAQIAALTERISQLRTAHPLQVRNLYLCYGHADAAFVEHLETHLQAHHILSWRDVHDAPAGQPDHTVIRTMRQNPTMLVILSEHSVDCDWVGYEIDRASTLERSLQRPALCLVALDDSGKTHSWPEALTPHLAQRSILDGTAWRDAEAFEALCERLIACLGLFHETRAAE